MDMNIKEELAKAQGQEGMGEGEMGIPERMAAMEERVGKMEQMMQEMMGGVEENPKQQVLNSMSQGE